MSRRLDIEEIDAALRRAASKAIGGTREERSGRFLRVQPSSVTSVRYDHAARALDLTFMSGPTYRYLNVPLKVYIDLLNAQSKDEFVNENIKDEFACSEVRLKRQRRG